MTPEEINRLLSEALAEFNQKIEELKRAHRNTIEKILEKIRIVKLEQTKKNLGI